MPVKGQPVNNMGDWSYERITPSPYFWGFCLVCRAESNDCDCNDCRCEYEFTAGTLKELRKKITKHLNKQHGTPVIKRGSNNGRP